MALALRSQALTSDDRSWFESGSGYVETVEVAFFLDVEQEVGVGAMAFDGVSGHT
jgi:hypothetical protein